MQMKALDTGIEGFESGPLQGFGEVKGVTLRKVNLRERLVSQRLKGAVVIPVGYHGLTRAHARIRGDKVPHSHGEWPR